MNMFKEYRFPVLFTRSANVYGPGQQLYRIIPRTISISSNEIASAIESQLTEIALTIVSVLDKTPPELAADVIDRGIMVTGGGAMLNFIDKLLLIETGVPIHLSDYPRHVVAKGALLGLNFADSIARSFSYMDEIFSTANE